jgi:hypothetical protein
MTVTLNTNDLQDSSHQTAFSYIQYHRMKWAFWRNKQDSKSHIVMATCYYAMFYEISHLNPANIFSFPDSTFIKVSGRNKSNLFLLRKGCGNCSFFTGCGECQSSTNENSPPTCTEAWRTWNLDEPSVRHYTWRVKFLSFDPRGNYDHIKPVCSISQLPVSYCLCNFDYATSWTIRVKNPTSSRRILSYPKHLEELCSPPSLQKIVYRKLFPQE